MKRVSLYDGLSSDFIIKSREGLIAIQVERQFRHEFEKAPAKGEVQAWENSLRVIGELLSEARLDRQGVFVEMQLSGSSERIDLLIVGRDTKGSLHGVVVELKQWSEVATSENPGLVETFVGGGLREAVHPSEQANGYREYLSDCATVFASGEYQLSACAFLHNAERDRVQALYDPQFLDTLSRAPLFLGEDAMELKKFLEEKVGGGGGNDALDKVRKTKWEPAKKLLSHVAEMISGLTVFTLLEHQRLAFLKVRGSALTAHKTDGHKVFIIKGGPGTGKSVVAMNLLADLASEGLRVQYVTGSRSFTETLRKLIGSRGANLFKYTHNFVEKPNLDALVIDEAHRIRVSSNQRFTPKSKKSNKPQIDELIGAARVTAFFIDENQVVRPTETGSIAMIRAAALRLGALVEEVELSSQFRCGGSDDYIRWVADLLQLDGKDTSNIWDSSREFRVQLHETPAELEHVIRKANGDGLTARLSAGFCWPWSNPNHDGTLIDDVQLGDWSMPWNAKSTARKLHKAIPKSDYWATDPRGVNQVGCIYTAQGFEYDHAGVIWGSDLVVRNGKWVGQPKESKDSELKRSANSGALTFEDLVKNTYRVLLTRGMRGCHLYVVDEETRQYIASRISQKSFA